MTNKTQNKLEVLVVDDHFEVDEWRSAEDQKASINSVQRYASALGMNLTITKNYSEFKAQDAKNYDFYIIDGNFPIDRKEAIPALKKMLARADSNKAIVLPGVHEAEDTPKQISKSCLWRINQDITEGYDLKSYAGAIVLDNLNRRNKNYMLNTSDPSHGSSTIELSLICGNLDKEICPHNCNIYRDYKLAAGHASDNLDFKAVEAEKIALSKAVVFSGDKKAENLPAILKNVSELFKNKSYKP